MRNTLSALAFLTALTPIAVSAATIKRQGSDIVFQGPITFGDAAQFAAIVTDATSAVPVRTIKLNSPGGLVSEALAIANVVKSNHMDAVVMPNGMCASACFLPFAAGRLKIVELGAVVGVHNATTTGGIGPDSENGTRIMVDFARSVGVSEPVLARMKVEPSVEMGWLGAGELQSMGAIVMRPDQERSWTVQGQEHYDAKASEEFKKKISPPLVVRQEQDFEYKLSLERMKATTIYQLVNGK